MKENMTESRGGKGKWVTGTASVLAMSYVAAWAWNSFVKTFPKELPYTDKTHRTQSADKLANIMVSKDKEEIEAQQKGASLKKSTD